MKSWLTVLFLAVSHPCWGGVYEDGLAAKKAGRHEEAAQLLARATAQAPDNAEAWFHYGTVLGWTNRHDEAITALLHGLQLAPQDFDTRLALARVYAWKADYPAADRRLAELEKDFPDNLDVAVMRGRVAGWRGDTPEARRRYQAILQKDPAQVDALTGLGDIEAGEQRIAQARELYQRALEQDPSPDIQKRLDQLRDPPRGRVDIGVTGSTFQRGDRDDWWSSFGSYSQKLFGWDVWLRGEVGQRFDLQDETYEIGAAGSIVTGIQANVFAGFTPDADFCASSYVDASLRWRLYQQCGLLGNGWLLTEMRWADYEPASVLTTRLGWEQELGGGWTVNAHWLHFGYDTGAAENGWIAFLAWEPKDRWYIRVGGAQTVESLTNQTLSANDSLHSWTVFSGLVLPISEQWHLRVDLEREDVKDSVVRYGAALGVGRRF